MADVKVVEGKDTMTVYVVAREVLHHQFDTVDSTSIKNM